MPDMIQVNSHHTESACVRNPREECQNYIKTHVGHTQSNPDECAHKVLKQTDLFISMYNTLLMINSCLLQDSPMVRLGMEDRIFKVSEDQPSPWMGSISLSPPSHSKSLAPCLLLCSCSGPLNGILSEDRKTNRQKMMPLQFNAALKGITSGKDILGMKKENIYFLYK